MHFVFFKQYTHFNALYFHSERAEQLWLRTRVYYFLNIPYVVRYVIIVLTY